MAFFWGIALKIIVIAKIVKVIVIVMGETFVSIGEEEDALRREAVSARPAALLVVVGQRLGQRVVDHVAHVWLVDAHAECDRRTDDLQWKFNGNSMEIKWKFNGNSMENKSNEREEREEKSQKLKRW